MDTRHYKSLDGVWFQEIVSRDHTALKYKQDIEIRKGNKTTLEEYDTCSGQWILTIEIKKVA